MSASSPIELLTRIAPISDDEAAGVFGAAGRENLLDAVTRLSPRGDRSARRRLRRPLLIAVAAVAAAAATGAGWVLTHGDARETTAVQCLIDGQSTVIDATSGDPAADCAVAWRQADGTAPPLTAYDNGLGGVTVIPSSQKPPASWKPIASQDVALIELQESFDDLVNGLNSACLGAPAARAFAQQELDRFGFVGWTVRVRSSSQRGQLCYGALAEPETRTVTLMSSSGPIYGHPNWPPRLLADSLKPLTKECLSLSAMRSAVEQRASALGFSQTASDEHNYQLKTVRGGSLRCAALYETVTGTITVILRGSTAP